ncbi:MAG: hypothetical protein Q9220_000839 [cf. Caloplaca sp. 1 TL-2023]
MDPIFRFPASPGTPLFPVSPERANRQALPQSPSLPTDLHDSFKSAHLRENSDVQNKVAQFNSLSKEAVQRRKDNEAAIRRAVLGREEAENETRRLKDESKILRRELEEGRAREKKVAERLESVMEDLHKTKETQSHAQAVYEKEVRRARKEAFKSSSALVQLQEELKMTRNRYTLMREEVDVQKRKVDDREQETAASQNQVARLQEDLDRFKQQIKVVEEERDALKTNLQQEQVARIAAEGKIALPPSQEANESTSPKKRRRESVKENMDPEAMDVEEEDIMQDLREELRVEKKLHTRAKDLIHFMKMECQFGCCPCRVADQERTRYVHDSSLDEKMEKVMAAIPKPPTTEDASSIPLPEPSDTPPSSPPKAPSSPLGQTTEMLINFSPTAGTLYNFSSPQKERLHELPPLPPHPGTPTASPLTSPHPIQIPLLPPPSASALIYPSPQTPRPLPLPPTATSIPQSIRAITYPGTTTITVPLAPIPVSPDRTITRAEALEQIRQRRGRARSIAAGNGTPRKALYAGAREERRDLSAPAR